MHLQQRTRSIKKRTDNTIEIFIVNVLYRVVALLGCNIVISRADRHAMDGNGFHLCQKKMLLEPQMHLVLFSVFFLSQ